jgi:hypothetical protein
LALFGRRPPERADSSALPASENLHMSRTWQRILRCRPQTTVDGRR